MTFKSVRSIAAACALFCGAIDVAHAAPGSTTLINLDAEKNLVVSVEFINHRYFSKNTLKNVLHISDEAVHYLESPDDYQKTLLKLYDDAGFPNAKIDVQTATIAAFRYHLQITIDEGMPLLLDELAITGNIAPLTKNEVMRKLQLTESQHVDPTLLKAAAERLRRAYVERGFLSAQIQIDAPKKDLGKNLLSVPLSIQRGPLVQVRFHTNKYFFLDRDSVLEKTVGLADENRFSKGYLEEAVDRLKEYYQEQGFNEVAVRYTDAMSHVANQEPLRKIDFFVDKGRRTKIRSLRFVTEEKVADVALNLENTYEGDPYNRDEARDEIKLLQSRLQELGYHDAGEVSIDEIFTDDQEFVDLVVNLNPGKRYYFGATTIVGGETFNEKELRRQLTYRSGRPFLVSSYETSLNRLRAYCRNQGYRTCDVTQSLAVNPETNNGRTKKDIRIVMVLGERVRIGKVFVQGNRTTHDEVVDRELKFSAGDLYSPERIETSQRNIQRLGFFTSVQIEESNYDADNKIIDLVIKVREKKPRNIRFRVGYGSDEGARLAADFSYLNLAGTGRNIYLSTGLSRRFPGEIIEGRVVANYIEPHLFSSQLDGRLQFSFERNEEEFGNLEKTGFFVGAEYNELLWLQNLVKWEIEFREPFDLKIPAADLSPFDQSRRLFGSLGNNLTLDLRDNPFNPTFGYFGQIQTSYYSEAFLSEEEFYQVFSRNTVYLPIYKLVSFTLSLRIGFAATVGSTADAGNDLIPVEKRFRLGGAQSLRGFNLDSVGGEDSSATSATALNSDDPAPGGNSVFNYMAELGFPLPGGFRLVGFTDGGNAYVTNEDFNPFDIRTSAGFGLRYVTPIGPLRLDFGFKLDKQTNESIGELHFAVGLF